MLFAPTFIGGSTLGSHIEVAFSGAQRYASGKKFLCEHVSKGYHLTATIKSVRFVATASTVTFIDNISTASQ